MCIPDTVSGMAAVVLYNALHPLIRSYMYHSLMKEHPPLHLAQFPVSGQSLLE